MYSLFQIIYNIQLLKSSIEYIVIQVALKM